MDNRKPSIPGGSQTPGYLPIVAPRASHAVDFFTTPEDLCRMAPPATSPVTATTQSPNCTLRRQLVDKNDQIHLRRSASGYALRRFPPHTSISTSLFHSRVITSGYPPLVNFHRAPTEKEQNMPNATPPEVKGGCYCKGVRFLIPSGVRPIFAGYCHCLDCRQAHAAPIYQYVYVYESEFSITEGSDLLKWYTRSEAARDHFKRYFCVNCGTKVFNSFNGEFGGGQLSAICTFPSLFDDQLIAKSETWTARIHEFCSDSILDLSQLNDGLTRFPRAAE